MTTATNGTTCRRGVGRRGGAAACVGLACMLVLPAVLHAPSPARAGDRELELRFARVDDGSDAEATRCVNQVRGTLASSSGWVVHLMAMPRDVLMTRLGVTTLDGFVSWPRERFAGATHAPPGGVLDALVLLDCQPAARRLDLVVLAGTGAVAQAVPQRLSLRDTEITPAVARFVGTVSVAWQTRDFSP